MTAQDLTESHPSATAVTATGTDPSPVPVATSRNYFNGCQTAPAEPPYEAMVGPLSPTPNRSLADFILLDVHLLLGAS